MNLKLKQYCQVFVGNLLFALGVHLFLVPCGVNSGGIFGVAQILDYLLIPINPFSDTLNLAGIINALLNVPLYILAYTRISKSFCFKTLFGIVVQTATLSLMPIRTEMIMPDILSNCICGAVMGGVGLGLTLRASACAGGTDILGVYYAKAKPNVSVGRLSVILNACVFSVCAYLFNLQSALFSIIYVMIMYVISDKVHYQNINISAMIFTKQEQLKNIIMEETGRGVTYWNGKGAFTDQEQYILVCALNKYEIRILNKIVQRVDPNAFVILNEGPKITGGFEKRF